jgi:hypothetical protein
MKIAHNFRIRIYKRGALLIAALASLAACASGPERPPPLEVPMQRQADGRIVVEVMTGGRGPYPFVLDTGASVTILDLNLVAELGLGATGEDVIVHGVAASATAPVFQALPISIGGEDISPPWVVALDLSHLGIARGVLGVDVLRQRVLEIDGDLEVVRFGSAPYAPLPAHDTSRADLVVDVHGLPHVEVTINNAKGLALIDTGLGGMIIDPAFAARARVPVEDVPIELVDVMSEAAASRRSGRARLRVGDASWRIDRIALLRPSVLDEIDAGAPTEAILGARVFANTTLVLDYGQSRLFVVDQREARRPGLQDGEAE